MTPEEMRHGSAILLAAASGKIIQLNTINSGWVDHSMEREILQSPYKCYRIKPEKRECWVNFYNSKTGYAHRTKAEAQEQGEQGSCEPETIAIHMREVMDE